MTEICTQSNLQVRASRRHAGFGLGDKALEILNPKSARIRWLELHNFGCSLLMCSANAECCTGPIGSAMFVNVPSQIYDEESRNRDITLARE